MADVTWTLVTSDDGSVTADAMLGEWPTIQPGTRQRVQFKWDPDTRSNYTTIRKYLRVARPGAVATMNGLDTTPYYRELHTETEDLLLGFNPSGANHASSVTGWWGVLVGGQDRSNEVLSRHVLELETYVLDTYATYANAAAAEAVHEK